MTWVLDASAVLCWLLGEPGVERMKQILAGSEPAMIHAVNFVEVRYRLHRLGARWLRVGLERIAAAGIHVVRDMDDALLTRAARLKVERAPIALGDVFAVALAAGRGATLLTTDRTELEKVALAGECTIEFLR